MMAEVSGPPEGAQQSGVCLLRTADVSQPDSWQAWDGDGFDATPTSDPVEPDDNICTPLVDRPQPWSLTYNRYLKKYMMLGTGRGPDGSDASIGVYYRLSEDLVNWGDPLPVMLAPNRNKARNYCDGELSLPPGVDYMDGVTYPVVLDPNDPANPTSPTSSWPNANPNFERPGPTPDLYFSHLDVTVTNGQCTRDMGGGGGDPEWTAANVSRLPVDFRPQRQATFEQGLDDPTWGFDGAPTSGTTLEQGSDLRPEKWGYGERDLTDATSTKFVKFAPTAQAQTPHGTIDVKWQNTDEVWYGGAFFLPADFQSIQGNVDILRWTSAEDYGGVGLRSGRFRITRNAQNIGEAFDLPTGQWTWLEVHQKLGRDSESPYSEVFVDGHLVASTVLRNREVNAIAPITQLRVGYASIGSTVSTDKQISVDRVSILGTQRGAYRGTATSQAPETPTWLKASPAQTVISLYANTVQPAPDGYVFHRRRPDATTSARRWVSAGWSPTPTFYDSGLTCDTEYEYRVAAYRSTAPNYVASIVSAPVKTGTTACSP
jgi:hypothetical protein